MSLRPRPEFRVEAWWGRWCVAKCVPGQERSMHPVFECRWRWQAWREAVRLARLHYGDAVLREKYYTDEEKGFG